MAEQGNVHPIGKKDLEAHLKKVDEHLESINRGDPLIRDNLFEVMKGIGSGNKNLVAREAGETVEALRRGFSLFYQMSGLLEDRVRELDGGIDQSEKTTFTNSFSMFAAGSYIAHQIGLQIGEQEPFPLDTSAVKFRFDVTKDDMLNLVLSKYFALIGTAKRKNTFESGADVPRGSYEFFIHLREESLKLKDKFNPQLVDLVKNTQFRVEDTFTISGFEAGFEDKVTSKKIEIVPVEPHEVAGNVLAKQEMLRDMDRLVLFDLTAKRNPILEVGGLSWSVLYDGLPGTGKDTLFKVGLTRLMRRCEQVGEFWKRKNLGELLWTKIDIDQGVKDEFYGKTGKILLEKLAPTKRADGLYIVLMNDIDLLVSGDRNSSSGGADKDIMNILMQYADSVNTVIRGNVQLWAATNDATTMDPALRQRFISRYAVDGPQEWYDFADILHNKLRRWIDGGIVELGKSDYRPFEMRKGRNVNKDSDEKTGILEKLFGKGITMKDIGEFCAEQKKKNERFTGRAMHAVSEAVKKRINDYEIPEDWYVQPEIFFMQSYETRVEMLKGLCQKVNGDIIMQEIDRYARSEGRYADDRFESDVARTLHTMRVHEESIRRVSGGNK